MRKEGLEPTHPFGYQILSLARLPVPPLSRPMQRTLDSASAKGPAPWDFPWFQAVFRRRAGRAGSIRGRTRASDGRLLVTISSSTGPRAVARELIIRRAGTRCTTRPARRARSLEYSPTISSALEFDSTTVAPRVQASATAAQSRVWSADVNPSAV